VNHFTYKMKSEDIERLVAACRLEMDKWPDDSEEGSNYKIPVYSDKFSRVQLNAQCTNKHYLYLKDKLFTQQNDKVMLCGPTCVANVVSVILGTQSGVKKQLFEIVEKRKKTPFLTEEVASLLFEMLVTRSPSNFQLLVFEEDCGISPDTLELFQKSKKLLKHDERQQDDKRELEQRLEEARTILMNAHCVKNIRSGGFQLSEFLEGDIGIIATNMKFTSEFMEYKERLKKQVRSHELTYLGHFVVLVRHSAGFTIFDSPGQSEKYYKDFSVDDPSYHTFQRALEEKELEGNAFIVRLLDEENPNYIYPPQNLKPKPKKHNFKKN